MSFHKQLSALRERAATPSAGLHRDSTVVLRRDLSELLHHFDRLDAEARNHAAEVASLRQHKTDYMEAAEQTRRALAADNQRLREALIAASKAYSKAELGLIVDAALAGSKEGSDVP